MVCSWNNKFMTYSWNSNIKACSWNSKITVCSWNNKTVVCSLNSNMVVCAQSRKMRDVHGIAPRGVFVEVPHLLATPGTTGQFESGGGIPNLLNSGWRRSSENWLPP